MKKIKGFTLVELVIVIAIVIILSVVSVPIYRGYTRNAKMSEGYALLGVIFSAQKNYFSERGTFLRCEQGSAKSSWWTCNDEVLGIDARGNKYFTLFMIGGNMSGDVARERFVASAKIPDSLVLGDATYLRLLYNFTTGSTFFESNAGL